MTTNTPIFIPYNSEPERCPQCKKIENKKTICKHCGYEYKVDDDITCGDVVLTIMFLGGIVWIILTIFEWLSGGTPLLRVFLNQWEWIKSIRLY
ncbi:MAG: hypothetical protein ACFFG0_04565 [Candidatus Thorarchaeota archaeon]